MVVVVIFGEIVLRLWLWLWCLLIKNFGCVWVVVTSPQFCSKIVVEPQIRVSLEEEYCCSYFVVFSLKNKIDRGRAQSSGPRIKRRIQCVDKLSFYFQLVFLAVSFYISDF